MYDQYANMGGRVQLVKSDMNTMLEQSGWPTLSQDEIGGILRGDVQLFFDLIPWEQVW